MKKLIQYIVLLTLIGGTSVKAESYTLEQFLGEVLEYSNELKLAAEDLKYARASKKEAVAGALPTISSSAGYNRNLKTNYMYVDFGDEPSRFKITKDNEYRMSVRLDQTLFSGAVYNAIRAAKEYGQLTELMYQASQDEILTLAKKSFYQAMLLREVYEVSRQAEANALENFNEVNDGYEAGLKSEFDKLQAEVRYRELIPHMSEAERNLEIARMNLKSLAGLDLESEFQLDGSLEIYPTMPTDLPMANILTNRPDYNALIWEEKLRHTGVRAEKAGRMPTVTSYLAYNYSAQSDDFRLEDENNSVTVGLNLSLPIFTGGRTSAKIRRAEVELNRARINIDRSTDLIATEARNIRLRLGEAFNRIESARTAMTTAQKAFEIAQASSEVGLSTQLELKDSRVGLDKAEVVYFSAIYEYLEAYFDWQNATGQVQLAGLNLN